MDVVTMLFCPKDKCLLLDGVKVPLITEEEKCSDMGVCDSFEKVILGSDLRELWIELKSRIECIIYDRRDLVSFRKLVYGQSDI